MCGASAMNLPRKHHHRLLPLAQKKAYNIEGVSDLATVKNEDLTPMSLDPYVSHVKQKKGRGSSYRESNQVSSNKYLSPFSWLRLMKWATGG